MEMQVYYNGSLNCIESSCHLFLFFAFYASFRQLAKYILLDHWKLLNLRSKWCVWDADGCSTPSSCIPNPSKQTLTNFVDKNYWVFHVVLWTYSISPHQKLWCNLHTTTYRGYITSVRHHTNNYIFAYYVT